MTIRTLEQHEAQNPEEASLFSNIKKNFIAGMALGYISQKIYVNAPDFRLNLPGRVYQLAKSFRSMNTWINQPFGHFYATFLTIPYTEEMLFRGLLQELILKKVPTALLRQFYPSKISLVNGKLASAARIITCAGLFALAHARAPEHPYDSAIFLGHKFAVGVCCGIIQEMTGNLYLSTTFHSGFNLIPVLQEIVSRQ